MKKFVIISFLLLAGLNGFGQENRTYILEGSLCKGTLKLNDKKKTATLKIKGNCDYQMSFKGTYEILEDGKIKVLTGIKPSKWNTPTELIIDGTCFIWDKDYKLCEKK